MYKINLPNKESLVSKNFSDKNSLLKKNVTHKNKNAVDLYMRLEKLVNAKSRSIDIDKKRGKALKFTKLKGMGHRDKKDFLSEDKEKINLLMNEKKPRFFHKQKMKPQESHTKSKDKKRNKYYQYLRDKYKNNKEGHRLV